MPTEVTHTNIQPTIDLTMGVHGRDLGHVSDDVDQGHRRVRRARSPTATWAPYDPAVEPQQQPLKGSKIVLSGEYARMQDTFRNLGFGLILALAADLLPDGRRSPSRTSIPLSIMLAVPLCLVGRPADALPHRHGGQRAVAAGVHLHRGDQGRRTRC